MNNRTAHSRDFCRVRLHGEIENSGELEDLLFYDRTKNKSFIVKKERKGVKLARLKYSLVITLDNMSLVEVELLTGRTHQIRVQFANIKHPLVGDRRYGSSIKCENIMLTSKSISFINPITKEEVNLEYIPDNDLYKDF